MKDLGERLWLDSGTMTPVLKKLKGAAKHVPMTLGQCVKLSMEEAAQLHELLCKVLFGLA